MMYYRISIFTNFRGNAPPLGRYFDNFERMQVTKTLKLAKWRHGLMKQVKEGGGDEVPQTVTQK